MCLYLFLPIFKYANRTKIELDPVEEIMSVTMFRMAQPKFRGEEVDFLEVEETLPPIRIVNSEKQTSVDTH
jgi:hypothetical protein